MNVISARSPFEIIINETGQTGSKVELFIWNKGTTEPTTATYVMSENIASATQTETNYNVSPYILEYINQIYVNYSTSPIVESNTDWCFARIKRYKNVSGTYTLLANTLYIGVNGFTDIIDGLNYDTADSSDFVLLGNTIGYKRQYNNTIPYYNFLCTRASANNYIIKYYTASGTLLNSNTFLSGGSIDYYNYRLPLAYNLSSYCEIVSTIDGILYRIYTEKIEECKYTPINVSYVNKLGGWQQLTMFKAQTNKVDIQGSKYNLMPSNINYNIFQGQNKSFNINGKQTITCNTGWVYENYNNFITELMLSDTILIDNKPVIIKTQSLQYKTDLLDKNINFTLEFEYSNNLLNNVI